MNKLIVVTGVVLLFALGGCDSGNDPDQDKKAASDDAMPESVFHGYVEDVDKARKVQKKVDAARRDLKAKIKQAENGGGG